MLTKAEFRALKSEIRKMPEYLEWRTKVWREFVDKKEPILKNKQAKKLMQVHHIVPLAQIMEDNDIRSLGEARLCPELWDIANGCVLTKGSHFLIERLYRKKAHTKMFITMVEDWLENLKNSGEL